MWGSRGHSASPNDATNATGGQLLPILFEQDDLPDSTWGLCLLHAPSRGIVRLVDENGTPAIHGTCIHCWEEMKSGEFHACPIHGVQRKVEGREGCPTRDRDGNYCLGEGAGPTEDEVERLAESYNRLWPGGPAKQQNVLAPQATEPESGRDRETGEGARDEAGRVPGADGSGVEDDSPRRDSVVSGAAREAFAKSTRNVLWRDPFLEP